MNYSLIQDIIGLVKEFEEENSKHTDNLEGFKQWIAQAHRDHFQPSEPLWEGKAEGRSPESVINTLIVHMNRYAKNYSKSAIYDSEFSTQDDFIYLINLKAFGEMSKMELIKKNIQDKSGGMLIINRLQKNGWINQKKSKKDRRSSVISISKKGREALKNQMRKIRQATNIVAGDLNHQEKMTLIRLLQKLDTFHQKIYDENIEILNLLNVVEHTYFTKQEYTDNYRI